MLLSDNALDAWINAVGAHVKTFKSAFLGMTFLAAASCAASAADIYKGEGGLKDDAVYMPPITWTGFYAGVHAGVAFNSDITFDDYEPYRIDNAFIGGVHVGYNWQTPSNWVYGVEASLSFMNDNWEDYDVTDYLASIRGRLGYAMDNTLVYATGGVAFLGYDDKFSEGDWDDGVGYVVGGGAEYKLTSNISVGLEGLYYNLDSDLDPQFEGGMERDFWTVEARLNYHFTSAYEAPLK